MLFTLNNESHAIAKNAHAFGENWTDNAAKWIANTVLLLQYNYIYLPAVPSSMAQCVFIFLGSVGRNNKTFESWKITSFL